MKHGLAALVWLLVLAAPAGAWTFQRHDCKSVEDWAVTNTDTLVSVAKLVVPLVESQAVSLLGQTFGIQPAVMPSFAGQSNAGWIGGVLSGGGVFASVGASPLAFVNAVLHLVCVDLST